AGVQRVDKDLDGVVQPERPHVLLGPGNVLQLAAGVHDVHGDKDAPGTVREIRPLRLRDDDRLLRGRTALHGGQQHGRYVPPVGEVAVDLDGVVVQEGYGRDPARLDGR